MCHGFVAGVLQVRGRCVAGVWQVHGKCVAGICVQQPLSDNSGQRQGRHMMIEKLSNYKPG